MIDEKTKKKLKGFGFSTETNLSQESIEELILEFEESCKKEQEAIRNLESFYIYKNGKRFFKGKIKDIKYDLFDAKEKETKSWKDRVELFWIIEETISVSNNYDTIEDKDWGW
jgi:uroporphyrinogen-III synthase